tara:strand:- start:35 stop:1021 length:987 start_codon:yes stop_codon:yes gene_type:complete
MNKKKILVTGSEGFIGSHLVEALLKKGYKVRALSLYNSFNHWGWLDTIKQKKNKNLEVVSGDVRDYLFCEKLLSNIDIVFNLASLISIPYSYDSPESFIDTNIKGTYNLCVASKKNKIKNFFHISTSEVYGSAIYTPIDENHPLQPQSPYSATKISSEAIAQSFYYSFSLPLTIIRPFNTYGPRQSARAIIPSIIIQILNKNKIINLGNTDSIRDFTYVVDQCNALIKMINIKNINGQIFNLGSNKSIAIKDLIIILKNLTKSNSNIKLDKQRLRPKKSEVNELLCDNSKIKKIINNYPKTTFKKGLKETINWFNKNIENYKSEIYNI